MKGHIKEPPLTYIFILYFYLFLVRFFIFFSFSEWFLVLLYLPTYTGTCFLFVGNISNLHMPHFSPGNEGLGSESDVSSWITLYDSKYRYMLVFSTTILIKEKIENFCGDFFND
jgi:hypothetical protein